MKVEPDQNVFHCEYCGGYDFSDPNRDGIALLGEPSQYDCPVCGVGLVTAAVNNIRVFSCPNCRGSLVDQSKLHPILRQARLPESFDEEVPRPLDRRELGRTSACPSCRETMEVYPYGGAGSILIQGCARCGLVWLDFGELSAILRSYKEMEKRFQAEQAEGKKWGTF